MDTISKEKRSETMRAVKNKNSKIEILLRKEIWFKGIRYRKNPKGFFGKPDLLNKTRKIVFFIDSCFWHGCKKHCRMPSANQKYWKNKIERNQERDKEVSKFYKQKNWKVIRIWEHDIKDGKNLKKIIQRITNNLE